MDYSILKVGDSLAQHTIVLGPNDVSKYISAVEDESPLYSDSSFVPPTAIAALSLKGILEDLGIPGGTVHLGQELEFLESVKIGQTLTCVASIVQNSVRGPWRFLSVEMQVRSREKNTVLKGRSTIMVPV